MSNRKVIFLYSVVALFGTVALMVFLPQLRYRLARDGLAWVTYVVVLLWSAFLVVLFAKSWKRMK